MINEESCDKDEFSFLWATVEINCAHLAAVWTLYSVLNRQSCLQGYWKFYWYYPDKFWWNRHIELKSLKALR